MPEPISDEAKREVLQKIAASAAFARSGQLRAMLLWLGEKAIEGAVPSEYEVAIFPLRRPRDFDPQSDSLVRKEMNRLRVKLRLYYEQEGSLDAIRIFSADAYRLHFVQARQAGEGDKACILVLPLRGKSLPSDFAEAFYHELLVCLAQQPNIQLIAETTARYYAERLGDIRLFAAEAGADFVIEGRSRQKKEDIVTTLWAVDGRTGHSGFPCTVTGADADEQAVRAADCLIRVCLRGGACKPE